MCHHGLSSSMGAGWAGSSLLRHPRPITDAPSDAGASRASATETSRTSTHSAWPGIPRIPTSGCLIAAYAGRVIYLQHHVGRSHRLGDYRGRQSLAILGLRRMQVHQLLAGHHGHPPRLTAGRRAAGRPSSRQRCWSALVVGGVSGFSSVAMASADADGAAHDRSMPGCRFHGLYDTLADGDIRWSVGRVLSDHSWCNLDAVAGAASLVDRG